LPRSQAAPEKEEKKRKKSFSPLSKERRAQHSSKPEKNGVRKGEHRSHFPCPKKEEKKESTTTQPKERIPFEPKLKKQGLNFFRGLFFAKRVLFKLLEGGREGRIGRGRTKRPSHYCRSVLHTLEGGRGRSTIWVGEPQKEERSVVP